MATREKKLAVAKKQQAASPSPVPPSKEVTSPETAKNESSTEESKVTSKSASAKSTASKTSLAKKLTKKTVPAKANTKKPTITIKLKPKQKKKPVKVKPKINKPLLTAAKETEKKKLLKNGVSQAKPRKRPQKANKDAEKDDKPPVLEPILPIDSNIVKKVPKKKVTKKITQGNLDSFVKKMKLDTDDSLSVTSDLTDTSITDTPRKKRATKKIKVEHTEQEIKPEIESSLEEVMNDLTSLISNEEIKKEPHDSPEPLKSENVKPKRLTKRKTESLKNKIMKKENIENRFDKLDPAQRQTIDRLDLNVSHLKKCVPIEARRHSIEKIPLDSIGADIHQVPVFGNLPRSLSPRTKRASKVRQSIDGATRKSSPYMRSDSPARILRNGKHRKLKDMNLLEGINPASKKRKRLCSDFSASEFSKFSGYDSDSSFSDLASLHGDSKDADVSVCSNSMDNTVNKENTSIPALGSKVKVAPTSAEAFSKKHLSTSVIDTNSNLYDHLDQTVDNKKMRDINYFKSEPSYNSSGITSKVPDKSFILDIMKQTFNDIPDEKGFKQELKSEDCSSSASKIEDDTVSNEKKTEDNVNSENNVHSEIGDNDSGLRDNSTVEIPLISPVTPTTKEMEKSDDLKLDEIILKLEEAMDTEEITTPPQSNDVTLISNDIISTPVYPEALKSSLSLALGYSDSISQSNEKPQVTETEKVEEETQVPSLVVSETVVSEPEPSVEQSESSDTEKIVSVQSGAIPIPKEQSESADSSCEIKNCEPVEPVQPSNNDISESSDKAVSETVNEVEEKGSKEDILQALGLQSTKAAEEAKQKEKEKGITRGESYTGTLKTVIKLNRDKKKTKLKISNSQKKTKYTEPESGPAEDTRATKEGAGPSGKHGSGQSSDTAGAHRKSHYSNRSNMDGSSEHTSDGEGGSQDGAGKVLVIPEKASSFSIHPGRLCKDECSYCFGKFGLLDTPCHIAQIKNIEKQNNILSSEKHLTHDSCLCEACYRHIDRKANTPSYINKSDRRRTLIAPGPRKNHCHVLGCGSEADNEIRRKWIIKMKKSVCQVINIDLDNPGLHSIPICKEHYAALEHLMVCALCKRKLAKNHIHYLGSEMTDVNEGLSTEGIPVTLADKSVICKLCKCFCTLLLKGPDERDEPGENFFEDYKRRLLQFNSVVPMDEALVEEPLSAPTKEKSSDKVKEPPKKKRKIVKNQNNSEPPHLEPEVDLGKEDQNRVPSSDSNSQKSQSRSDSPSDYMIDYNTLVPSINMECGSDGESSNKKEQPKKQAIIVRKLPRPESVKEAVAISKKFKNDSSSDIAVQRLGSNPSISVRQLFPGEEDLPVTANIDFGNVKEKTPEGWEKCSSTIQYDLETKQLWQELQKPYGNQSSFLRHLVLLEKYFRNGDLVLSPSASHHSANYAESVQNRLRAYDNIPSNAGPIQPLSMIPFNKPQKSNSGIITSVNINKEPVTLTPSSSGAPALKNAAPLTITQVTVASAPSTATLIKAKSTPTVPGLIQLHPGTARPVAPLVKVPQPQKIKFPITKNWRPTLIPIDPSQKGTERKPGLVQVVSGGKPYHITLEDYKKMCAIKRNFEAKQKLQEAQAARAAAAISANSVLKRIVPGKGLIISKATNIVTQKPLNTPLTSFDTAECENSLEKLDKQVEKLEASLNEAKQSIGLPKIPKSLTVIPQTVTRKPPSRPTSPGIQITPKPKQPIKS